MHNYPGNSSVYPTNIGLIDDSDTPNATNFDVAPTNLADRTAYLSAQLALTNASIASIQSQVLVIGAYLDLTYQELASTFHASGTTFDVTPHGTWTDATQTFNTTNSVLVASNIFTCQAGDVVDFTLDFSLVLDPSGGPASQALGAVRLEDKQASGSITAYGSPVLVGADGSTANPSGSIVPASLTISRFITTPGAYSVYINGAGNAFNTGIIWLGAYQWTAKHKRQGNF